VAKEYRAKVFKSGNSVALRLPKALGITEGTEMLVREERGKFEFEPVPSESEKIDLTGIWGACPGIERMPFDESERDWSSFPDAD